MNILFLDDCPNRTKEFRSNLPFARTTETVEEFLILLAREDQWDALFLDHDLCGEAFVDSCRKDCGMEVVRHLVATPHKVGMIVVHSHNPDARLEMVRVLKEAGYEVQGIPFYIMGEAGVYEAIDQQRAAETEQN